MSDLTEEEIIKQNKKLYVIALNCITDEYEKYCRLGEKEYIKTLNK